MVSANVCGMANIKEQIELADEVTWYLTDAELDIHTLDLLDALATAGIVLVRDVGASDAYIALVAENASNV